MKIGRIGQALREMTAVVLVGCLIGAVLAVVANLFVEGELWLARLRATSERFVMHWGDDSLNLASVVFLLIAAVLVVVIRAVMKIDQWSGPAEAIYAAQQDLHPLDVRKGLVSTLAAFVSAGGGASVGQYGPIVHFGATVGVWLKRVLVVRLPQDVYLGCGVAAAISAAFNAPLAGVIFAHEAVLRHFSLRAIAPIAVASIAASGIDSVLFPGRVIDIRVGEVVPPLTTLLPLLVAVVPLLSLVAVTFMVAMRKTTVFAQDFTGPQWLLPLVAALICGGVGMLLPEVLGLGTAVINDMIAGNVTVSLLLAVLVAKIAMTALCLGLGLYGGVFAPALFVGVAAGALVGQLLAAFGIAGSGVIGVAGMAAVGASVVGAPLAVILIVLELTGSYAYTVAAMITVILTSLLCHRLFSYSYYDRQLLDQGVNLRRGRLPLLMDLQPVGQLLARQEIRLSPLCDTTDALARMRAQGVTEGYVCDDLGILLGKVNILRLLDPQQRPVSEVMDCQPLTLGAGETLSDAVIRVADFVGETIPVVDRETGRLLGVVSEGDLFRALEELQARVRSRVYD